jgi:tetraacyldisaccharide 4'-kinase
MRRPWLTPLTPLYAAGLALRNLRIENGWEPVRRLRFPVVSIGNLSTGGAGKTPLTIALAKALTLRGLRVDVLSRGYGRISQRPARVDADGGAEEFGDEPLLIARQTGVPVYVARQRFDAGLLAEAGMRAEASGVNPPVVHLLDDGFQHRQLHRDIDILLLDGRDGRDSLLPAGNLREPLKAARRASVIAIPAQDDAAKLEAALRALGFAGPVWRLHRKMEVPVVDGSVAAFCGIARPEQFFAGLEAAAMRVATRFAFPDHHRYSPADLQRLVTEARTAGATAFITTEKDQVRLGALSASFPDSLPLKTAGLCIEIEHEDEVIDWLVARIPSAQPHPPL